MNERNRTEDSAARQSQQRAEAIRTLRSWEQEAENGRKLTGTDRLKAALHLSRAWREANEKGLRKEDFQDAVFARLKRRRENKTRTHSDTFKLANWILPRKVDAITPNLVSEYAEKREPLKSLEPYLVGVGVAAMHCGVDPDDWKLDLMRDLSIWTRPVSAPEVAQADNRPAETLSLLLNALCRSIAHKNRLREVFSAIRSMSCRWEMFDERLVASTGLCMEPIESPVSPVCDVGTYFEEMFPFPSIPLLRVPYLVGTADFRLAPDDILRPRDETNQSGGGYVATGSPMRNDGPFRHYSIPDDAPMQIEATGRVVFHRELRLTIAPDGHGDFCAAIESRPRVEITFADGSPVSGTHIVHGGYEPDVLRGLFYARHPQGGGVWPTIKDADGRDWRLRYADDSFWDPSKWVELHPETSGWQFEPDPVGAPGEVYVEPWYLSYTPATPDYLKHWLTQSWTLAVALADCPWSPEYFDWGDPRGRYNRDLPPHHALNFPNSSHANSVERCLHNGLIEEALQAAVTRLAHEAASLQRDWFSARDAHAQGLLTRWHTPDTQKD